MSSRSVYWSFLNEENGRQIDGLTFLQAEFIASLISKEDRFSWLIWHEGLPEWRPMEESSELANVAEMPSMASPPKPPRNVTGKSSEKEPKIKSEVDQRLARRFLKSFGISIKRSDGSTFQTKTVNLSMGGMLLQDDLPKDLPKSFEVTIHRKENQALSVFCTTLRLPAEGRANRRLRIVGTTQEGTLRNWLVDEAIE